MMTEKIKKLLNKDFSYPATDDEDFQNKIYEKREFYYNRPEELKVLTTYPELKKYRESICMDKIKNLQPHQAQVASLFTPETPLRGAVLFWDTGSGKTCAGISIAENFKEMVTKYGTKIHVLVPGRLIKEEWKKSIITCTKETYLKDLTQVMGYIGDDDGEQALKQARNNFSQYYKIMSHVGFYKKVLGQKIIEHVKDKESDKMNKIYRKTSHGDYERDIGADKIESLDNSVLIIDEAHHITGNDYGMAVKKIIQNSKNLRVFLLSATPMKNLADDMIKLVNFIRPDNDQIDRDMVFTKHKNHLMAFKEGGREYFGKMLQGYISYAKGANAYLYAKQIDMGDIPNELMFTRLTQCTMNEFQINTYIHATENYNDALDKKAAAASNFAFPYFCTENGLLEGKYGIEGINAVRTNIKTQKVKLFEALKKMGVKGKELITDNEKLKTIGGDILRRENLHIFSTKFTECVDIINSAINEDSKLGFIYSNFVKIGIELFEQVLLMNGYLEYEVNGNYSIKSDTRHYLTGESYEEFIKKNKKDQFFPATFVSVTGGTEEGDDQIPEEKKRILDTVFSIPDNKEGKFIKLVLGSKVMTEGVTIRNVGYIVILDTAYHLGQIIQVVGRGIRFCVHNAIASEDNPYPEVKVYKLIVEGLNGELSSEGVLYQKAEQKYLLVKDCERLCKENAIDCPTNYNANISKQDMKDYDGCIKPLEYALLKDKGDAIQCPLKCDFQDCLFKCAGKKLNLKHYDKNNKSYKKIPKNSLDFSTFTHKLARNEINFCKEKIKEMYRFKYIYALEEILDYVKNSFTGEQYELFEEFFCYKALDELILITENDFNNFHDFIYDKNTVPGYLIYRNKFYIFQPINQHENVPMYYRTNYVKDLMDELTLNQYFKNTLDTKILDEFTDITKKENQIEYDFDNVLEYYDTKEEAKYVGIIDKPVERKKIVNQNLDDIFKIRERKSKNLAMKRGTGIQTLKGSVCFSSKDKKYLLNVAKAIGLTKFNTVTRTNICDAIRLRMLYLEKYSRSKDNNKVTWLIIPFNHPTYAFPLNLEDRVQSIIAKLHEKVNVKVSIKDEGNGIFESTRNEQFKKYILKFGGKPEWDMFTNLFIKLGFTLKDNTWTMTIE